MAIETRVRGGALMPGPRVPAPQPLRKLRHTKTIGTRCGFMVESVVLLGPFAGNVPVLVNFLRCKCFAAGWLSGMTIHRQTQPQKFSLLGTGSGSHESTHKCTWMTAIVLQNHGSRPRYSS